MRLMRASALRCAPAEFSGAKSVKKRCVGFPSMALKSTPPRERPKLAMRPGRPGTLPWGIATPSPIPVEPSFSRSSSVSSRRCGSTLRAAASGRDSSARTAGPFRPEMSSTTAAGCRNSTIFMGVRASLAQVDTRAQRGKRGFRRRRPPPDRRRGAAAAGTSAASRLDQAQVPVLPAVDDVDGEILLALEDEEVHVQQVELEARLVERHGLRLELVGLHDALGRRGSRHVEDVVADVDHAVTVRLVGELVALELLLVLLELP